MALPVGAVAPDFTVKDTNGNAVSLSNYAGKTVVLYFYPKDDTPGCTKQACSFRDATEQYQGKDIVVLESVRMIKHPINNLPKSTI